MSSIRVAMVAPPWLPIPPVGYGGLENVLYALVPELMKLGVHVELFATGDTTLKSHKNHWLYETGQYKYIHRPQYDSMPVSIAQLQFAINTIRQDGGFDLIHDHNGFLGPLALANTPDDLPPAIHTLHGPPFSTPDRLAAGLPDNLPMWRELGAASKMYIVPISKALVSNAPRELKPRILAPVYNMLDVDQFPLIESKDDYFITLARFSPEKGHHIAVQACVALGYKLKMAGVVADIASPRKVTLEIANPASTYRSVVDFRYFSEKIFPHLSCDIEYVGEVGGDNKLQFIGRAKALLFPLQWDEPFGMVAIEAMACGTPVIAMRRGAMPEIIEHGVNGFLADNLADFKKYMKRVGSLDPNACRESIKRKFSAPVIAKQYLARYKTVLARHGRRG